MKFEDIPDDVKSALAGRSDVFQYPVPENPFLRLILVFDQILGLFDEYDKIAAELHALGFHQIPRDLGATGLSLGPNGGMCNVWRRHLMEMLSESQVPMDEGYQMDILLRQKELRDKVSRSNAPKAPPKKKDGVIRRLGYRPLEWRCSYCRKLGGDELGPDGRRWHVDHMYPKVHGGDNKADNKALSCATCNGSKGSKSAVEFARVLAEQNDVN